jgi:hypothetical protein
VSEQVRDQHAGELAAAKAAVENFAMGINSKFETRVSRANEITCEINHKN